MPDLTAIIFLKGESSQFETLQQVIDENEFSMQFCSTYEKALGHIIENKPAIIFIDFIFDDRDAIAVLKDLSDMGLLHNKMAIVFGDSKENFIQISALNAGADDYLIKPVNKRIFAAKLNSWSKRSERGNLDIRSSADRKKLFLDADRFSIQIDNNETLLQRKEFEIISLLLSKPGKVFTRSEIVESIWDNLSGIRYRTIDVHIRNLRSKIGPRHIKTIKGVGYSYKD